MTEVRVEHRVHGIIGRLIRDNESPLVRWEDTGKTTKEDWADLVRLDGQPVPGRSMHYFTLTAGGTVYTALTFTEAHELQAKVGGVVEHQFANNAEGMEEWSLEDFDLPPGMYPDSDMGCTE
jgi:hypothetical protein